MLIIAAGPNRRRRPKLPRLDHRGDEHPDTDTTAITKRDEILRGPGDMKLFADPYADMSEEHLVGSAVRIETERLEICDGVETQKAHDTIRLRLDTLSASAGGTLRR